MAERRDRAPRGTGPEQQPPCTGSDLSVSQSATVTGRVEEFGLEEAERETEVDPNDEALAEREGKPSIFAATSWTWTTRMGEKEPPRRVEHLTQRDPPGQAPD